MKYPVRLYARAFTEALSEAKNPGEQKDRAERFVALVRRNGDAARLRDILAETERLLLRRSGKQKVLVESARPLTAPARKGLEKLLSAYDVAEEKIDPRLVGGIKITVNDELQFDASLARTMEKLFA